MKLSSSSLPSEKFIWQVNEFPLFPRAAHKGETSSPKGSECEVIARALFFLIAYFSLWLDPPPQLLIICVEASLKYPVG